MSFILWFIHKGRNSLGSILYLSFISDSFLSIHLRETLCISCSDVLSIGRVLLHREDLVDERQNSFCENIGKEYKRGRCVLRSHEKRCFYEFASSETKSKSHLFLYSPGVKFSSLWQTHNSTSFCTVPISSSMAYCKLTTAPIFVQSQFQVQWLKANSQQHLFFCTVPVSS